MSDLVKRLRIKAGMIEMGEMIAWGSDSALMREAADALEMAAPAVQGEPVAWQLRTPEGRVILNKEFPAWADGGDGYKITPLYTAPQPAEQQPCPEGIREGAPYDDPAFESLCREHEIWGTAAAAQCAVFWEAGKRVAEQKPAPDVSGLVAKMEILIAAGNRLNANAEECNYDDGTAEVAGSEYWCEFRDALDAARAAIAAPQPAEQQPALAKYQPCGCVVCTCEHETRCQGCGAHHCGTHPVGQIPEPVYQQPAPDVSALVEELVEALELARIDLKEWLKSFPVAAREPTGKIIERIDAALASHRKQETSHDNQ